MGLLLKATSKRGQKVAMVGFICLMETDMREIGAKTNITVLENTAGRMGDDTMDNGLRASSKELVTICLLIKMSIMVSSKMTKKTAMATSNGQMVGLTQVGSD